MNAAPSSAQAVVHIVDDDEGFRTAMSRLLRAAGYEVRAYGSAGAFLLERQRQRTGCVLLDLKMPGPNGLELQDALVRQDETLPIIFLTGHGDIAASVRAMKAGAVDFLTKPVRRETLLPAVQSALEQDVERRAEREQKKDLMGRVALLTAREREVLEHVIAGKPNKWIAGELGTAERTVKAHRAQVMRKMNVVSVAELVQMTSIIGMGNAWVN
jgi:FixJ family two-component response regulator